MAFLLANKLANPTMLGMQLMRLLQDAYDEDPSLIDACVTDLQAVYDRDPACDKFTQAMLYFKGFQAVQCHRIAHHLWRKGRKVRGGGGAVLHVTMLGPHDASAHVPPRASTACQGLMCKAHGPASHHVSAVPLAQPA